MHGNAQTILVVAGFLLLRPASYGICQDAPCSSEFRGRIARLMSLDRLREADSLFDATERGCAIDVDDLMKWMRIKGVLGDYSHARRIACDIVRRQPRLSFAIQNQLLEIIKEAPSDTIKAALEEYRHCALSLYQSDTAAFRQWIAGAYFRFGFYDEELRAIRELHSKSHPSTEEILGCAYKRFSRQLYSRTIEPALLAYHALSEGAAKSMCAVMLYQSYARCGKNDSAALWLGRTKLSNANVRAEAAAFYQQTGFYAKADSLIALLPPSLTLDTLRIRGLLFAGDPRAASELCARLTGGERAKSERRDQLLLWRARVLVFSGVAVEAGILLDSIDFSPAMGGAHAVVSLKFLLKGVRNAPNAWKILGELAYAGWLRRPESAAKALESPMVTDLPRDLRRLLTEECVATLAAGKSWAALRLLVGRENIAPLSPQTRYYYGVSLVNLGEIEAGRAALEELLIGFPGDVYSEKARIFLSDLNLNKAAQKP